MHVSLLLVHMAFLHVLFVHIYCEKSAMLIHDSILKQGFGWFLPRRQLEKEASDVSLGRAFGAQRWHVLELIQLVRVPRLGFLQL